MALTQDFKSECDRIINTWHPLIQYWYDKGSSYKELVKFMDDNRDKVLNDPFYLSFKTTRTFEEIKWMWNKIQTYYLDDKPTGALYYINTLYQTPKEPKDDIQRLMYNYQLLRTRFWKSLNEGGLDNVNKELETANTSKTKAEGDLLKWTNAYPKGIDDLQSSITAKDNEIKKWSTTFPISDYPNGVEGVKTQITSLNTTISDQQGTIKDKDIIIDKLRPLEAKITELEKQLKGKDEELGKRNEAITSITNERNTAQSDLKKYTDNLGTKTPAELKTDLDNLSKRPDTTQENYNLILNNQEKHTAEDLEKHKPTDLKPADLPTDWKTQLDKIPSLEARPDIPITKNEWENDYSRRFTQEQLNQLVQAEKNKYKDCETNKTELDKWHEAFKDKKPDEVLTERPILSQTDKDKIANFDTVNGKLGEWQTNFPNQKPSELKKQVDQQATQPTPSPTQDNQYLNKLIDLYKKEIKKRTELLYQDLGLDESDEIRPEYKGTNYLTLLDGINGDSEPDQVINAFKIVSLVAASKRAKKWSDEMDTRPNFPAGLKKNRTAWFKKLLDNWNLITETPKKENNPLYIALIDDLMILKQTYKAILTKWQST